MSLNFYLTTEPESRPCTCNCGNEHTALFTDIVFDTNITHNLNNMADAAGIYKALWRPDENNFTYAKDIIKILEKGLKKLKASPDTFKAFDASNGWGTYEHFVPFVEEVLQACKEYPDAKISVSR